jgi:hypothetical protein
VFSSSFSLSNHDDDRELEKARESLFIWKGTEMTSWPREKGWNRKRVWRNGTGMVIGLKGDS